MEGYNITGHRHLNHSSVVPPLLYYDLKVNYFPILQDAEPLVSPTSDWGG